MQQFGIVGEPVLNGDEGSYLIPVKPETGYAEAALVEPWTCVVAAYRIKPRKALKPGGVTLIVGVEDGEYEHRRRSCAPTARPAKLILAGLSESLQVEHLQLRRLPARRSIKIGKLTAGHGQGSRAGADRRQGLRRRDRARHSRS